MKKFSWTCPYCTHISTIGQDNCSTSLHSFNHGNKDDDIGIWLRIVTCPNEECREYAIDAYLYKTERLHGRTYFTTTGRNLMHWRLRPRSKAKPFPDYIPKPITDDYKEACLILDLSPKASATLSRRCLQGIIRDFWGISKARLIDEVDALKGKVDSSTWDAIDAVRSIGNIGAHMEKDINLVLDVDPDEAELLVGLIEIFLKDWYIARHDRQRHLAGIVKVAEAKKAKQAAAKKP